MAKPAIRVAIVGLGNCASTLVQGITHYRRNPAERVGLIHPEIGGLSVGDIRLACAFDVDARKIGGKIGDAIFAAPNNARIFCRDPDDDAAKVFAGPVGDGVAGHLTQYEESRRAVVDSAANRATPADVVRILKETGATVLVNYLPVGSQRATEMYAQACLDAGIGMVNCIPVFIASEQSWAAKFKSANLPIVGDDVKSQFGATITHRVLMALAEQRGIAIDSSYQVNFGGNTDFLNMLEKGRLTSKKISKTEAVTSNVRENKMDENNIHIGPSDYVPFLEDKKVCYVRMNMRGFGGLPMELDMKLQVEDSPNSAGVVVDAVRCIALAQQNKIGGVLEEVSAYLMKRPIKQMPDEDAAGGMDAWIKRLSK
jgi:myo-inositol-1-phosphate synthase